jgi:peptide/nickel transport system substrate-binding protein
MQTSKRLVGLAAVAAAALLAVSACQSGGTEGPPTSSAGFAACDENPDTCNTGEVQKGVGEITYAIEQEFTSWNITTDEGNAFAGSQTLAGIVPGISYFAPSGTLKFNLDLLVEDPQIASESPQTMVYKIRPEAVWSDGTPITADDFMFNWRGNSGKPEHCDGCVPASTSGYELIESIEAADNGKTVTVKLAAGKVYAEWQGLFTLYPAHIAKAAGHDWSTPAGMASAQSRPGRVARGRSSPTRRASRSSRSRTTSGTASRVARTWPSWSSGSSPTRPS